MSQTQKISDLSQQLQRAVSKPHTDAILDSLFYLKNVKCRKACELARFVSDLYYNEPVNMQALKGFSSEMRGWCISWVSAYMRGEINQYADQIKLITATWFNTDWWGSN